MSGVSPRNSTTIASQASIELQTNTNTRMGPIKTVSNSARGYARGYDTIVVLGVNGEAELLDEELADLCPPLPCREVQRGALVGVPHAGGHGGRALPVLIER
jgi:hypothetical protein